MNYDRCDKCLHSRLIVSENGIHTICCLSQKKAVDCLMGKVNHYKSVERSNENAE
jgi:hypothetical protein